MARLTRFNAPEIVFVLSCAAGIFAFGAAVGHYEIFPFQVLKFGVDSVAAVAKEKDTLLGTRPTQFLLPARHAGNGVTTNVEGAAAPGLTLIYGFFEGGNQIRLVRADGSVVHRWPVKYYDYFPDPAHIAPSDDVPRTDWNAEIHGALPLPDGSIVFNFNYLGTVKLDRCGQTQWTLPHLTHHAVSQAEDGTFLIPSWRYLTGKAEYPNLHPPYRDERILKVSQDGKVLADISLFEILYRNNYQGILARAGATGDIVHVNDVEELPTSLADRFPMFAPGDLMISMRKGSSVIVVDPKTLRIKWYQSGPWKGQHDPDFLPNGRILVFNNNDDADGKGRLFGGSNIMEIDPATREITYRYGMAPGQPMFTESSGKHQELPGGNVLVTEAKAGRLFEAEPGGRIVWEYINRYDEKDVAVVTEGTRYPDDYFQVRDWSCSTTAAR